MKNEVKKNDKVRFGLVGYGAWGTHHARAIQETAAAELVGIAARSLESQAAAKEAQPLVEVVADYHQLLNRSDIDVIDIVVPTHLHLSLIHISEPTRPY